MKKKKKKVKVRSYSMSKNNKVRSYSMSKKKSPCAKSFRAGMNVGRNMKKKKKK